jgi:hypothetical protein
MGKVAALLAVLVLFALPAAGQAAAPRSEPYAPANVTTEPVVQLDLRLAVSYWKQERPELTTQCPVVEVEQTPLEAGEGAPGAIYPANAAWAQTVIGDCLIKISPAMWDAMNEPLWIVEDFAGYTNEWHPTGPLEACVAIIHEYGHVLGLPDTESPGMMEFEDWNRGPSPCDAAFPSITENPETALGRTSSRRQARRQRHHGTKNTRRKAARK